MPSANGFALTVHDAYGGEVWSTEGSLTGNQAAAIRLGDYVPASDTAWGIVTVDSAEQLVIGLEYFLDEKDSAEQLVIGLEYFLDEKLISIDTIYNEAPVLNPSENFELLAWGLLQPGRGIGNGADHHEPMGDDRRVLHHRQDV